MINKGFFVNKSYKFSAYTIFFLSMAIGGESLMASARRKALQDYELKVECQPNFSRNNGRCFQNCPDAMETEGDYCVATLQYVGDCPIDFIPAPDASGKLRCLRNSYEPTSQCGADYTPIDLPNGGILCKGGCPKGWKQHPWRPYCYIPNSYQGQGAPLTSVMDVQ
jgi:hypothetical protein